MKDILLACIAIVFTLFVSARLTKFAIDGSRLTTDGKGESQPSDNNTSPEDKANNRRVKFIKH